MSSLRLGLALILIALAGFGVLQLVSKSENVMVPDTLKTSSPADVKITDWRTLRLLDFKTGVAPQNVKELDGAEVRIPGFMVPLEDDMKKVTEFLLVPTRQACIHVPPPPPNQIVYVKMATGPTDYSWGPIWVQGQLKITPTDSPYGKVSYEMLGRFTKTFSKDDIPESK